MGYDELKDMAQRFWEGKTTEAEEERLKENLLYGEVPPALQELADYFRFQEAQRSELSLDENFDHRVMSEIDRRSGRIYRMPQVWKMAASIALLIGFVAVMKVVFDGGTSSDPDEMAVELAEDTYEDPEQAFAEVKEALMLVSKKMNKSSAAAEGLSLFNQAEQELQAEEEK